MKREYSPKVAQLFFLETEDEEFDEEVEVEDEDEGFDEEVEDKDEDMETPAKEADDDDIVVLADKTEGIKPKKLEWPNVYSGLGLTEKDIPELCELATDTELFYDEYADEDEWFGVIHAWWALYWLHAEAAAAPLVLWLLHLDKENAVLEREEDMWLVEHLPIILGKIGKGVLPLLQDSLADSSGSEMVRIVLSNVIADVGKTHADVRNQCIDILAAELAKYNPQCPELHADIVAHLLDFNAVDRVEVIREAYAKNVVDYAVCGDMEEVEIALGLRTERSTPARNWLQEKYGNIEDLLLAKEISERIEDDEEEFHKQLNRKIGRNEPCHCGSGKKYKKCCLEHDEKIRRVYNKLEEEDDE